MTDRYELLRGKDCFRSDPDDVLVDQSAQPFMVDERFYAPAAQAMIGIAQGEGSAEDMFVRILLGAGTAGLFLALTPAAARQLADTMHKAADKADANGARHASTALGALDMRVADRDPSTNQAPGFPPVAPARGGRAESGALKQRSDSAAQARPLLAAIARTPIHTALDRFARWSPLIALLALALVARAIVEGVLAS